jgi:hypothetical protein
MALSPPTARKIRRTLTLAWAIFMATLIAAQAVYYLPLLRHIEQLSLDFRTAMVSPSEPQDSDIVIVAITDETLARFPYRSPIDRAFLSDLLKELENRGVRAIGLEVLFDQATEQEKDDALRRTIAELRVPLVVGYIDGSEVLDPTQEAFLANFVPQELRGLVFEATDPLDATVRWIYPGHREPNGEFVPGFDYALAAKAGIKVAPEQVEIAWHGSPENNAAEPFGPMTRISSTSCRRRSSRARSCSSAPRSASPTATARRLRRSTRAIAASCRESSSMRIRWRS